MTRALLVLALLTACSAPQRAPAPTATPTDLDRLCARPSPAPTDVIARALSDACLQIQVTPVTGR